MQFGRIVVAVLLLALASCSEGPSKEEFIEQADAICAEADAKTEGLDVPRTPQGLAEFVDRAQEISEDLLADIRALEIPEEGRETIEQMLQKIEETIAFLPDVQEAAESGDLRDIGRIGRRVQESAAEANRLAQEYGLEQCGRSQPARVPE